MAESRARRWWPAMVAAAMFVAAACGSDDDTVTPDDGIVTPSGEGWNPDPEFPTVISDAGGEQAIPKIAASGPDGFTVSWFSNPDLSNFDVRLQRYDLAGRELWEPGGLVVSDNTSDTFITDYVATGDDRGNSVLILQDRRTGSSNLFAYKLSPDGEQLWGPDGVALSSGDSFVAPRPSAVVRDGEVTFSFVRDVGPDGSEVVVQRLSADGEPVWGEGTVVGAGAGELHGQSVISAADDGGVFVSWAVGTEARFGEESLRLQRVTAEGTLAWDTPVDLAPAVPLPAESSLVGDGDGGVFVAWNDTDLRAHVQHIGADGALGFGDGGVEPSADPARLQIGPRLVVADGDPVVVWLDTDLDQRERGVRAQRIGRTGARQWGETGLAVVEAARADLHSVVPITDGEVTRVFFSQASLGDTEDLLNSALEAVDVTATGEVDGDRRAVSSRLADRSNLEVAIVGDVQIAAWNEREGERLDALMQDVPAP